VRTPSQEWSDQKIEEYAASLAAQIKAEALGARNEEELRLRINPLLKRFAFDAKLDLDDSHEHLIGKGRADSIYGRVVIEYESPGSLSDRKTAAANKHAVKQVTDYMQGLCREQAQDLNRLFGVVLDGYRIIFVRRRRDAWEVGPARDVASDSIADLLLRLRSLRGKALLPEALVSDFGGVEARGKFHASDLAARNVAALYKVLESSKSPKVDALFSQWRLLFSEVCGYEFASPKLDLQGLAGSYGVTLKKTARAKKDGSRQAEMLFFAIHTYYATVITLLAAEIVTFYTSGLMPSYLGDLEAVSGTRLRDKLRDLHETGGIFGQALVQNFLEGDFFSWFLEEWNDDIAAAVQAIVRALRQYDPATFQVEPEQTRDLLKKLYQYLLPKKLRHDLGEYYTPDWLAELVLNEVGYNGDLSKRILDPACGSGTFLALEIRRAREWAREKMRNERETLEAITGSIVGFDLNPLAVITARTNYLIALGDLLRHRSGPIEIPVYLCDAVRTPREARQISFGGRRYPLDTAVGRLEVPLAVGTPSRIGRLARLLEDAVRGRYRTEDFLARARAELGLHEDEWTDSEETLSGLYGRLCQVNAEGRNGIWARIIKNFFAPVFQVAERKFDYIAGNPPWVGWETLPDKYRQSTAGLWADYGMAPKARSSQFELGTVKRDLSALFVYVSADRYLRDDGKLGFLVTESLFTSGAGAGFRRLSLPAEPGQRKVGLRVLRVHNLVRLNPFEGASNRTAMLCLKKGALTELPVEYVIWRGMPGRTWEDAGDLASVLHATSRQQCVARPITRKAGSPWISGPADALSAAARVVGESHYKAWAGTCTWLNGVYWVQVVDRLPDGMLLIENLTEAGKTDLPKVRVSVEPDLIFPLLRGRNVRPWLPARESHIIIPHTADTGWEAIPESQMRLAYPLTLAYLERFHDRLLQRSGYQQLRKGHPFYILGNIGVHTFAPHKVVWRRMIPVPAPAVASKVPRQHQAPVPTEVTSFVALRDRDEAHYVCALVASAPCGFVASRYSTGKSFGAPHILQHIKVPRFEPDNQLHRRLSDLSQAAHEAAARNDEKRVREIEEQVDEAAAELWGITPKELKVIQKALREG